MTQEPERSFTEATWNELPTALPFGTTVYLSWSKRCGKDFSNAVGKDEHVARLHAHVMHADRTDAVSFTLPILVLFCWISESWGLF